MSTVTFTVVAAKKIAKKLYYDILASGSATGSAIVRFVGSTGAGFGGAGVNADRYGDVMDPNLFNGVLVGASAATARARQAISAWFQCASTELGNAGDICVDFVNEAGTPIADPTTVRRPGARVRHLAGGRTVGTLYIQRQHSIEV